jgi:hypothetical protein
MRVIVEIDAGVCQFRTVAWVTCNDGQNVTFDNIETKCEKIDKLGVLLKEKGLIDAYQEISPKAEGVIMQTARLLLKGGCTGCAVPMGLFKAMQVAAGLALPRDVSIKLIRE